MFCATLNLGMYYGRFEDQHRSHGFVNAKGAWKAEIFTLMRNTIEENVTGSTVQLLVQAHKGSANFHSLVIPRVVQRELIEVVLIRISRASYSKVRDVTVQPSDLEQVLVVVG